MTKTSPEDTTKAKFIKHFNDKTVIFKTWFPLHDKCHDHDTKTKRL